MTWLLDIIKKYAPQDGQADLFGVILYTNEHPHIKKVLNDSDYWSAFDEISGQRWAIFSTKAEPGHTYLPKLPPGTIGMLVQVWKEPNANKELLNMFELSSTEELPAFIAFALDKEKNVLKNVIKLDDSTKSAAYSSLKKAIETVTDAVEGIREDYLKDAEGVYSAISLAVQHHKDWEFMKKGIRLLKIFNSLR